MTERIGRVETVLFLVRHGSTALNEAGTVQGRQDVGLSEYGESQIAALSDWLGPRHVELILHSPLRRARRTAELITAGMEPIPAIREEFDLRERDYGDFEGLQAEDLRERRTADGYRGTDYRQNWAGVAGVESDTDTFGRFLGVLRPVASMLAETDVVFVSHAGLIRAAFCGLFGIPWDRDHVLRLDPGSAVAFESVDGHLRLHALRHASNAD